MIKSFPYRYRIHALLFFLMLITYLDRVCISLVGVRIKSAFNLNNEQFGWALGAFALAYALFEIPAGILGDRIGQRASLIRIVLWWSLFTALTGLTMGLTTLVITRFLFGMGEAGAFPNSTGTISRWFPKSETCRGVSFLFAGVSAGAGLAPLIIIPLASAFGWRTPFFVIGVIGLVWVLVCYRWFRNNPSEMKNISPEERTLIENNRRFTNHRQPLQWKKIFKIKTIWAMVISFFCSQWALYFFVAWMPVYLQEGRHFTENQMKFTTSFLFTVGIISALLTGWLGDLLVKKKGLKFTRRTIGTFALCIVGVLFFLSAQTTNNSLVVVYLVTAYFCLWPFSVTAFSTCVDIGGDSAGTIAGVMNFSGQAGALFLALIFGKIVDNTHNFNAPLYVVTAVLITGGLAWLAIDPETKIELIETEPVLSSHGKINYSEL
jgi:MFS transporter, ACS family, glucarate transporter